MVNKDRKSGRGNGAIRIGAVTVQGRWWFSYTGETPADDFKLTVALARSLVTKKKVTSTGGRGTNRDKQYEIMLNYFGLRIADAGLRTH